MKTSSQLNSILYVVARWFTEPIHSRNIRHYLLWVALLVFVFVVFLLGIAVLRQVELHPVYTQVVTLLHQLGLPFQDPYP
jgi:hypothetical protein